MAKLKVDFTPPPDPNTLPPLTDDDKQRLQHLLDTFCNNSVDRGLAEFDINRFSRNMLLYIINGIMWRHAQSILKGVNQMRELSSKGVEDLGKVKNRISRLYGQGRLSLEDFTRLNTKVVELENDLKEVKEVDGDN